MTESMAFLLVRIGALLAVSLYQFLVRQAIAGYLGASRIAAIALTLVFVAMNVPGLYVALFSWVPFPGWLLRFVMTGYVFWLAGSGVWLLVLWMRSSRAEAAVHDNAAESVSRTSAPGRNQPPTDTGRRAFLRESFAGITILSVSGALPNPFDSEEYEIVHQTIRLPNLSPRHQGLRIALMSDIHSGPYMKPDELVPYFDAVKQLKADVILLPGDFVQNRDEEVEPICEIVKSLRAPYGVYGVTGNHEYFADAEHIVRELQHAGVEMLRNEHRIITPGGEKLALIGIDDVRKGHPFDYLLTGAVKGLDRSVPNILLCHKPYYFDEAAEWGINLMVSGHTHGGQIVLARVFNTVITPASLVSGYIAGLYERDSSQLYVTRGIGTVGLPYRLNCPPEITVLTLSA